MLSVAMLLAAATRGHDDHCGVNRARSHCRFVLPLIHFIPDSRTYSVPLFSEAELRPDPRREARRPVEGDRLAAPGALRRDRAHPHDLGPAGPARGVCTGVQKSALRCLHRPTNGKSSLYGGFVWALSGPFRWCSPFATRTGLVKHLSKVSIERLHGRLMALLGGVRPGQYSNYREWSGTEAMRYEYSVRLVEGAKSKVRRAEPLLRRWTQRSPLTPRGERPSRGALAVRGAAWMTLVAPRLWSRAGSAGRGARCAPSTASSSSWCGAEPCLSGALQRTSAVQSRHATFPNIL